VAEAAVVPEVAAVAEVVVVEEEPEEAVAAAAAEVEVEVEVVEVEVEVGGQVGSSARRSGRHRRQRFRRVGTPHRRSQAPKRLPRPVGHC
jgi:hypothetical protein